MKKFSDFLIKRKEGDFVGDKIKPNEAKDQEIIIVDYRIEPSTKRQGTDRLKLQIERYGRKEIVFFGSINLIHQIEQIPKEEFPFQTTIKFNEGRLEFT